MLTTNVVTCVWTIVYLLVFASTSLSSDVDMCVDDICAQILGQSGKINFEYDDQVIQVTMDSITERDADGNEVGNTGSTKHSFNSFASQDFIFSELYNTSYQGIDAVAVNFTASLVDDTADFAVQLYMFLGGGNISNHNETFPVDRGSFKFSYTIDYWPFCTINGSGVESCSKGGEQQQGEFLDFTIIIKNDQSIAHTDSNGTLAYSDSTNVIMPAEFRTSSGWVFMTSPYPMSTIVGSKTTVVFRFERFESDLYYDPILTWGSGSNDDSGAIAMRASSPFVYGLVWAIFVVASTINAFYE
mmetsp:Transcript_26213/g.38838  ORF Transcript_26213/g.38838 Transcript_26213/m.38838 type:complete len:301 (-) Transcript_26213:132-1034(-)